MRENPPAHCNSVPGTRPIWQYFALTFVLSWAAWLPRWLLSSGLLEPTPVVNTVATTGIWLGGIGPSLAAFILVLKDGGRKAGVDLARRALQWKIGIWFLPAVLLVPASALVSHLVNAAFGGVFPNREIHATPWMIAPLFMVFIVLQASEEFGWRGYALDRLQARSGVLVASLVVGCAWALWHLPMFVVSGFPQREASVPYGHFAVTLVAVSVLMTWMQNGASGSLVPAFLCHASINLTGEVLPLWSQGGSGQEDSAAWIVANGMLIVFAVAVVRWSGGDRLK
jgi:membrane protease YdiL (CAAX protease family)